MISSSHSHAASSETRDSLSIYNRHKRNDSLPTYFVWRPVLSSLNTVRRTMIIKYRFHWISVPTHDQNEMKTVQKCIFIHANNTQREGKRAKCIDISEPSQKVIIYHIYTWNVGIAHLSWFSNNLFWSFTFLSFSKFLYFVICNVFSRFLEIYASIQQSS